METSSESTRKTRRYAVVESVCKRNAIAERIVLVIVVVTATLVGGCAQIPSHELAQYRNAFSEVQKVSEDILVDFADAKEKAEQKNAVPRVVPTTLFSTQLEEPGKQLSAVEVRRTALRTIDKFNNVLVTLAEGKSVEAVKTTADGFVQAANKFFSVTAMVAVPGLSAISGLVQTLAGELEKARLREEFENAVRRGAPVIDRILFELIAEREDHILLRAAEAQERQVELVNEITVAAASTRDLVTARAAPPVNDPRSNLQTALNKALQPAAKALTFGLPLQLTYSTGAPPFGVAERAVAEQTIARIQELGVSFQANLAQYENLRSALNSYGAMLERTRGGLKLLVDALDRPKKFEEVSEELFQIAFSVKRDVEAYRAARKAAK